MPIPKIVISLGMMAVQMALSATRTIEGPRLKDVQVSTADPGTPIPNGLGRVRVAAPVIHAEPLKEKKKKRKGKGGKYKDWLYFNTASWVFAGHPAQRVRRIWFEKHLVYDATGEEVRSLGDSSDTVEDLDGKKTSFADLTDIYLGGEDQEPDPRMLAYIEQREGEGTCPAYRGLSRLDAKDFPLDKLGNKPPSIVEVEYEGIAGEAYPMTRQVLDEGGGFSAIYMSPSANYLLGTSSSADDLTIWDNQARSLAAQPFDYQTIPFSFEGDDFAGVDPMAIADNGDVYGNDFTGTGLLVRYNALGDETVTGLHDVGDLAAVGVYALPDDSERVVALNRNILETAPAFNLWVWNVDTETMTDLDVETGTGVLWRPRAIVQDTFGDVWAVGTEPLDGGPYSIDTVYFWRVVDTGTNPGVADFQTATGFPALTTLPHLFGFRASDGSFVVAWSQTSGAYRYLVKVDATSFTVTDTRDFGSGILVPSDAGDSISDHIAPGASSFWASLSEARIATEIDALTLDTIRSVDLDLWWTDEAGDPEFWYGFDRLTGALIAGVNSLDPDGLSISWRDFGTQLTLGTCIRYFSSLVGLTEGADYTVHADCDAILVTGYAWTQGTAKQSLELLLDLYDCECRIHDGLPQFIKRGSAVTATIETPDFAVERDKPGGRYRLTVANDTDLPRRAVLTYASTEADLQPATVKAERRLDSFAGVGELTIDGTTVTLEPDTAQQLVDRYFRRRHFCRISGELRLSARHLAVEPGDLVDLDFDGTIITCHVDKITDSADGSRHLTVTNDHPAIAGLGAGVGGVSLGRPESEIFAPGASTGVLLDVPLLTDAHDQAAPFLYLAGGPVDPEASYVGTEFHQSDTGDDETYAAGWDGSGSSDPMTYGTVAVPLGNVKPWIWDYGTTLAVALANGSLSSATKEQLLNNGQLNLFAYGAPGRWLFGQFRTATLTAPLTYAITNIIWGVRGTEHLIGTQEADDRFILLDSAVARHVMGASEIGDTDWYIAAAPGASPNPANEFSLQFQANAHRPYAAVHGFLEFDTGTDDVLIHARRRTRIGGNALNGQDVPLGEASEAWEADVYAGSTFKRTITGTSLPLTYTAAQQTTDFGAPVTNGFEVNLYQMNPTLNLRGTPLQLAA